MSTSARLVADATMDPSSRYPSPPLSPPNRHSTSSDLLLSLPSIPPFDPSRYRAESMQRSQSDQQHSYHPPPHHQQLLSPPEQRPPRNGRPTSNNNGPPPSSSSSSSARPASKKRASHNPQSSLLHPSQIPSPAEAARRPRPSAGPHGSSSSASVSLADLSSVHPAVAAYQAEHPRRQLLHFGRYVLLQTLGEGEFGKVKLGVHSEFGEEVAVKLIKKGNLDSEVRASKVEREIDVLRVSLLSSRGVPEWDKCSLPTFPSCLPFGSWSSIQTSFDSLTLSRRKSTSVSSSSTLMVRILSAQPFPLHFLSAN
jgi:protein-serine/threonine kinase